MTETPPPLNQIAELTPPPLLQPVPKRSSWPTVIGVISLVLAGLIVIKFAWSTIMLLKIISDSDAISLPWVVVAVQCIVVLVTQALLLTAGVFTMMRKSVGRILHLIWAGIRLAFGLISLSLTMRAVAGTAPPNDLIWYLLEGALLLSYPVFLLIWFSRKKIRNEVRSWGEDYDRNTAA